MSESTSQFVKMQSKSTNSFPSDIQFGSQMVTILVGPGKEKFVLYKNALTAIAHYLFFKLFVADSIDIETDSASASVPAERDEADLPEELPQTIQAFMRWLYPAFIGLSLKSLPPVSDLAALFQLYSFGYKYVIPSLEDAIVSVLYIKFAHDVDLWFTLGSNKLALETFLKAVPPESHLYRLVVRSLAYTIRLRSEYLWSPLRGILDDSNFSDMLATESRVDEVMGSVPSQLWGPILKEVLLMKTLGDWRHGFVGSVGWQREFLKRCEDQSRWR